MKFNNGCWLQKEGMACYSPKEVYYSKNDGHKLQLCAPTNPITKRGDTLEGVNLTLVISCPLPEVIRVQTYHHMGQLKKGPDFELNISDNTPIDVQETDDCLTVVNGSLSLEIMKNPWSMAYKRNGEVITTCTGKDLALMKTDWKGMAYDKGDMVNTYTRSQLSIGVSELIYGLGERFTPFVKNGQTVDIWNADGGTSTEQSYKNIPFYVSNKGYGVFVNHPELVSFEIGTEMVTKSSVSVEGSYLDYFFINGPEMKDVLKRYTDLTGKPSLPAPWTFGLWLSTSFTTNYDEKTVMSFVDGMFDRGINFRVFHFDCFWMKEFHWSNFIWDERVFPDPEGMLKRIKAKGLNICVWINSYIGQESVLFEEGAKKGYFIKRTNGDVWQWDLWQSGMAIVDFTNPDACKWFQSKLEVLLDMGVDCFKTDFGERIPTEDVVYFDGSDPKKMHNYYTYLYNKCVYELLERKRGKDDAVLFARSATVGGQKFPVHWGGDCWSDYESMEESLRGGLSLCMSGFGYWSHDIGGFESTSTPDVYKRWCAFGLLSSHSRLHGSSSYRVPWVYDEEAVDVVRTFTQLKAALMPYIYRNAIETSETGVPMMRSMVLEFTSDRNVAYIDKQYMMGDSLMVAPIFNDKSIAEFYLPDGKWTNFFTGDVKEGGKWYTESCDYLHIPLYVRENSIVAVNDNATRPDYDYADGVTLNVFNLKDEASTVVFGMNKSKELEIKASVAGSVITVDVKATKSCSVVLKNVTNVASVDGAAYEIKGNDCVITGINKDTVVKVNLK